MRTEHRSAAPQPRRLAHRGAAVAAQPLRARASAGDRGAGRARRAPLRARAGRRAGDGDGREVAARGGRAGAWPVVRGSRRPAERAWRERGETLAEGAETRLPRRLGGACGALWMPRRKTISDEAILDRALPLLARAGPSGFTMADLAREVGVASATLFQRFGDKQTLIARVFGRDNARFVAWLDGLPAGEGADVVIEIYAEATKVFGDNPSLADHLLWLREDIRDPTLNRLARDRFKLFRAVIVKRLPRLPISAERAADLLDAQYHGAVIQWALEPRGRLSDFVTASLKDW